MSTPKEIAAARAAECIDGALWNMVHGPETHARAQRLMLSGLRHFADATDWDSMREVLAQVEKGEKSRNEA